MPYAIKRIVGHPESHFDEFAAAAVVRKYGTSVFLGIECAPFVMEALTGTEEEALQRGDLPVGQLGGRFDDKDPVTGQRKPDTCCALEMAKFLGIDKHPALRKFLRAVTRVDSSPTASSSDLSNLLKAAFGTSPSSEHHKICVWAEKGVKAIIDYLLLTGGKPDNNPVEYVSPAQVLHDMEDGGMIKDTRIVAEMQQMMRRTESQIDNCIEMAAVSRAMTATEVPRGEVVDWLFTGLRWVVKQQERFLQALDDVASAKRYTIDSRFVMGRSLKFVLVHSDNPQVAKASRSGKHKFALCIVRRSSGNVVIAPNAYNHLDMRMVWALIRLMETPSELRSQVKIEDYVRPGTHPRVPHLYMMESGMVLNGSASSQATPISLSDEWLIWIIQIGFTATAMHEFNRLRGGGGQLSPEEAGMLAAFK